jgi:hypothetical protein
MELIPPIKFIQISDTHRLIPSRYPSAGILDEITTPEELKIICDLETWTNDRTNAQFGVLNLIPDDEWVLGIPNATIIMAAFCHPSPTGGRFNTSTLGAWYAAFDLETAVKETSYHRYKEFTEVGRKDGYTCMRQYLADFDTEFHDIRDDLSTYRTLHNSDDYKESQKFSEFLKKIGSNGILYNSVHSDGHHCLVSFRPKLVKNVRQGSHFNYFWDIEGNFKFEEIKT